MDRITVLNVTAVTPPVQGWPVAMYCPICKETTIELSPWSIKPEKGDYWVINGLCAHDEVSDKHNMAMAIMAMKPREIPWLTTTSANVL